MKILVIGSGGMLGYVTYQYLTIQKYQVVGITKTKKYPGMIRMDATDQYAVESLLTKIHFDVIVNCAALLVKASEEHKSAAVKLNTWLPHFLGEFCQQSHTHLIQVSTDAVFSGKSGRYGESSLCDPDSFYGKSKLLGEVLSDGTLTVRSGFWGADINPSGNGLFQWFMRQKEAIHGYDRAFFNGVSNLEFAKFIELAIEKRWTGIYHLCASDIISKYRFLCLEKEIFGKDTEIIADGQVSVDRSLVCTRNDISYQQKTFEFMMSELKAWVKDRPEFAI